MNELVPSEFYLSQNYPNPFSEKTTIKYCIACKTKVQVSICTTEGSVIEKLVDEIKSPGTYEVEFNMKECRTDKARNLAQGYYYYQMIAGDFVSEKKWLCINKLSGRLNMKTFIQTLFFFLVINQIIFPQWYHQDSGTNLGLGWGFFLNSDIGWYVGNLGTIIKTTNGGEEWFSQTSGTSQDLAKPYFIDSAIGWVCGNFGTILKTTNGGLTWFQQVSGTSNHLTDLYFEDKNTGWIVGGDYFITTKILKTTNGGINWFDQINYPGQILYSICFIDSVTGWAAGDLGTILKTTNGGTNWSSIYSGSYSFHSIVFTDYDNGWVVGWDEAMIRTTDGGSTWIDYSSGIGLVWVTGFFVDSYNGWIAGFDYLGYPKIIRTTNGGDQWHYQDLPFSAAVGSIFFVDVNTGWAGGSFGTILHTTNGGLTFVEEEQIDEIPREFLLSQNYPNPFNPSTKIKYSVPQSSNVTLTVLDILGNEIETLVNEEKSVGTYELTWDAANLPSGIYFYQLQADSFIETKKMILIK